jgi:3-polyprenyl-4-hydroxybenzoate decarboxylase
MEPISGFGDVFGYYLYGRTIAFPMYNINNNGMSSNPIGHITCNVTNKGRLY